MTKHKEDCLSINGVQSVKSEKGTFEFKNYFKQITVPFKIDADFECKLEGIQIYDGSYTKIYQYYIPCNFAYRVVCIDDKFSKPNVVLGVKMLLMNYLKQFLRNTNIVKK